MWIGGGGAARIGSRVGRRSAVEGGQDWEAEEGGRLDSAWKQKLGAEKLGTGRV